jgi:hypothetical protein
MKALAVCGFILAGLSVIGGFILSSNPSLPLEGFSAVIVGIVTAFLFVLPSTTLLVVLQVRDLLRTK